MTEVTTYYLEMLSPGELKDVNYSGAMQVQEMQTRQYQVNRLLYQLVGNDWQWFDKLGWTDAEWQAYAEREALRTWLGTVNGSPAGYFELEQADDGSTEIAYFGLTPKFIGQGHGGYLLIQAIKAAWAWTGTKRVWLHTCTLDHPNALSNYQARGMNIYLKKGLENND